MAAPKSNYITREGHKRLVDEFNHLWHVERPMITERVSEAAALGDRSDNSDYRYNKAKLRQIDKRLGYLADRIEELVVVRPQDSGDGRVRFGAWVTLENDDGEQVEYRIVGPDEFDAARKMISLKSPIGKAILGKQIGDEVMVERPKDEIWYTVVSLRYE